jgi:hypothetical protein
MRNRLLTLLPAALLLVGAARPLVEQLALKDGSRIWFDGTSTVRDWSCKAPRVDASIDAEAGAPAAVLNGQKAVRAVRLHFPVAQLDCENRTMNGHMLKALNADQHQAIVFTLTTYELAKATAVSGTLNGTLALNGQTRPITFPVQFADAGGALRATGSYALKMTDWGVTPPRLMMGTLRVGETITVHFDLLLQP